MPSSGSALGDQHVAFVLNGTGGLAVDRPWCTHISTLRGSAEQPDIRQQDLLTMDGSVPHPRTLDARSIAVV
jgi:hypothetical protein